MQGADNLGERVLNDDCIVRKMGKENKFEVIMSFTGGFDKKVKKLRLAPHWMNYEKHKYKKVGASSYNSEYPRFFRRLYKHG